MSSKTKIVVLHMKEVIYTAIFLVLLIILGILVFFMFGSGKSSQVSSMGTSRYTPGIYRSSLSADRISSIHLTNLSETTAAMFPLIEPALDSLASQIYSSQSLENLDYPSDQKYTSAMLIEAIRKAVEKAEVS